MTRSETIIEGLRHTLDQEPGLEGRIERSLLEARRRAQAELRPDLFAELEWPEDLGQYEGYLGRFARWVPRQSDAAAWKDRKPEDRFAKEVSDRLAHFFWLVDQPDHGDGKAAVESSHRFGDWLTEFARQWGSFLDTTESFGEDVLRSFIEDAPEYTIGESMVDGRPNMPSGWLTFNQFFARELNAGLRPVADPSSNLTVTSPADCRFQHAYEVGADSAIPATTIKQTHRYGNIEQLLDGSRHAGAFAGGTFCHYMLPPSAYHRFHVPVSGVIDESFVIDGRVFMQVDLEDHELVSRDSAKSGYEFSQTRGALTIDTSRSPEGDIGIVGVVPVGMSHVASVVLTAVEGTTARKGDEFGYFQFGGSDIILLFQAGVASDVDTSEAMRHVGSPAVRCGLRTS